MKIFKVIATMAALLASQSFAIIGFGVHYAPTFNTSLKAEGFKQVSPDNDFTKIEFEHAGFDDPIMHGIGFKLWVDSLTVVDFEATVNLQYASYNANLRATTTTVETDEGTGTIKTTEETATVPVSIDLSGTPFGKATPKFVAMNADLSVTIPVFTNLITVVHPFIGGGVTMFMNTFILDSSYVSKLVNDDDIKEIIMEQIGEGEADVAAAADSLVARKVRQIREDIQNQASNEDLNFSIGGHIMAGARIKIPYIPVAIYADAKYYFGGKYPTGVTPGNFTAEVGAGLSF